MTDLTQIPSTLIAGDTWTWTRELADYPAPTWTLTYYFQKGGATFSILATASGTSHLVTETATNSANRATGRYHYFARVASGSTVVTAEEGDVEVRANPATGQHDYRTHARRTLDAVEATLEGKASADQMAITLAGRSIARIPLPELLQWRDKLRAEVRAEEQGAGRGRNIKVRYGRP